MAWTSKFSGLPTLNDCPTGADSYSGGVFTIDNATGFTRTWIGDDAPLAYVDLATIGASTSNVLRVTGRFLDYTLIFGSVDLAGGGIALYGPGRDDANYQYSEISLIGSPTDALMYGEARENGVVGALSPGPSPFPEGAAGFPHQYRIYWNGTGSAFIIPDAGFGSHSVAAGAASHWYSKDDGTTWTRLGDRAIDAGVNPTRAAIWCHVLNNVPAGGDEQMTFTNLEVMEEGAADTTDPTISNESPAPGATGVDVDTDITVDITDAGSGVDVNATQLIFDGELVWDADADVSANHAVSKSAITDGYRYTINPNSSLAIGNHAVTAYGEDIAGNSAQSSWGFSAGATVDNPKRVTTGAKGTATVKTTGGSTYAGLAGEGELIASFNKDAGASDQLEVKTTGGPAPYTGLQGEGELLEDPSEPARSAGASDQLEIKTTGGTAGHTDLVGHGHLLDKPRRTQAGASDSVLASLADPDIHADVNDIDGNQHLAGHGILDVTLYDATNEPWNNPTQSGFYGIATNGKFYFDGVECAFGDFGTLAGGLRQTAWGGSNTSMKLNRGDSSGNTNILMVADDQVGFRMLSPAVNWNRHHGLYTNYRWLFGQDVDFDIQVDWSNQVIRNGGSDGGVWLAAVYTFDNYIYVRRRGLGNIDSDVRNNGSWGNYVSHGSGATSGKFRIVRSGSTLSTYYDTGGGWVLLRSGVAMTYGNRPMFIEIASNGTGNYDMDVDVSNFVIASGTTVNTCGWQREAASATKGNQTSFPVPALLVGNRDGVDILDPGNSNKLFMRFQRLTNATLHNFGSPTFRQRPNSVRMQDGTLMIGYGTPGSVVEGGSIWADFNMNWIRIHRDDASSITGADKQADHAPAGNWARDMANGHIPSRNNTGSYSNDHTAWRIPGYQVNYADVWNDFTNGYQYHATATMLGAALHRWDRWHLNDLVTNKDINAVKYLLTSASGPMTWCWIDPADGRFFYASNTRLYSIDQATYAAAFDTTSQASDNNKALPASVHHAVRIIKYGGELYLAATNGVWKISWPAGSWVHQYGPVGSGAAHEILPQGIVRDIQYKQDGAVNALILGFAHSRTVATVINIGSNSVIDTVMLDSEGAVAVAG